MSTVEQFQTRAEADVIGAATDALLGDVTMDPVLARAALGRGLHLTRHDALDHSALVRRVISTFGGADIVSFTLTDGRIVEARMVVDDADGRGHLVLTGVAEHLGEGPGTIELDEVAGIHLW